MSRHLRYKRMNGRVQGIEEYIFCVVSIGKEESEFPIEGIKGFNN